MFDHALAQAAQRRRLAADLRSLPNPERIQRVKELCIDTGGNLILPQSDTNWGPVYAELSLLGLYHMGEDTDAVIANWIKAAERTTALPPEGEAA